MVNQDESIEHLNPFAHGHETYYYIKKPSSKNLSCFKFYAVCCLCALCIILAIPSYFLIKRGNFTG